MTIARDEIRVEVERLAGGRDLPEHARPTLTAFLQHMNGLPVDQICPYCEEALSVQDRKTAWVVKCPCGKSENAFRGL